ncbi:unnamed protein product [Cochlearia groenlandica]
MAGLEIQSNLSNGENNDENGSARLVDLDVLHCPVCCDTLSETIFQCENGHIACSSCCAKLKNECTLCDLPIGIIRCRVMERVIKSIIVPCPNAKLGCTKNITYGKELVHEKECKFSPCSCPEQDCNYSGFYKNLYKHYHDDHNDPFGRRSYRFINGEFSEIYVYFGEIKYTSIVWEEPNDDILLVAQCFREEHGVYMTMSCIAPSSTIVGEFSSRIVAYVETYIMTFELPKVKVVRKLSFEIPKKDFMLIPSHVLRGELRELYLKLRICICKLTQD